jgi:hypothetical protein
MSPIGGVLGGVSAAGLKFLGIGVNSSPQEHVAAPVTPSKGNGRAKSPGRAKPLKNADQTEINAFNAKAAKIGAVLYGWFAPANPPAGKDHIDKAPQVTDSAFANRLCGFLGYSFHLTGLVSIMTVLAMAASWDMSPTSVFKKSANYLASSGGLDDTLASGLTTSNLVSICQGFTLLVFAFVLVLSYLSVDIPRTLGCLTPFATVLMLCVVWSDGAIVFGDASGNAIHLNAAAPGECPALAKELGLDEATRGIDMLLDKKSRKELLIVKEAARKKSEQECSTAASKEALKIQYWKPCVDNCTTESSLAHCKPQFDMLKALLGRTCDDTVSLAFNTQPSKQDHTDVFENKLSGGCDASTLVVKTTCRRKQSAEKDAPNEDLPTHWQAYCTAGDISESAQACSEQSQVGCAYWQCLSSLRKTSPSFWQSSRTKPMSLPPARVRSSTPRDYLRWIVALTLTVCQAYIVLCYLGIMASNSSDKSHGDEKNCIAKVIFAVGLLSLVLICKACCFAKTSLF